MPVIISMYLPCVEAHILKKILTKKKIKAFYYYLKAKTLSWSQQQHQIQCNRLKMISTCFHWLLCTVHPSWAPKHHERLTVDGDPDLGVVAFVWDLPDIEGLGACVGQEAEEHDNGVRWGKTLRMDLPVKKNKTFILLSHESELYLYHTSIQKVMCLKLI